MVVQNLSSSDEGRDSPHALRRFGYQEFLELVVLLPFNDAVHMDRSDEDENHPVWPLAGDGRWFKGMGGDSTRVDALVHDEE